MYLEENGIIGLHKAVVPQFQLILNEDVYVRGKKENILKFNQDMLFFGRKMNGMKPMITAI
ncbi:hypothetical protein RRV45_10255 [Bacillus sp. DTU_2020_1000418_1_SI_GHA_SEK_038]|uniref:hypothetical protein n=1 Tax=Bacillus sp. DTU_2020_1000418_1_SI_GHA_SEK_038 TaxID=3077585 RepID=UPI0028E32D8A|nr:hypothetical protein [Bacillus sp. DTU_2020_1000418_1_SI_GHA_SEK_038]WNS77338.1 hypothetical protein RRV45_10255 [Bacillus sp. DTU_2020_1000418_1_SI_GHA_SEK_038]